MANRAKLLPNLTINQVSQSLKVFFRGEEIYKNDVQALFKLFLYNKLDEDFFFDLYSKAMMRIRMQRLCDLGLACLVASEKYSITPEGIELLNSIEKDIETKRNKKDIELLTRQRIRGKKKKIKRFKNIDY